MIKKKFIFFIILAGFLVFSNNALAMSPLTFDISASSFQAGTLNTITISGTFKTATLHDSCINPGPTQDQVVFGQMVARVDNIRFNLNDGSLSANFADSLGYVSYGNSVPCGTQYDPDGNLANGDVMSYTLSIPVSSLTAGTYTIKFQGTEVADGQIGQISGNFVRTIGSFTVTSPSQANTGSITVNSNLTSSWTFNQAINSSGTSLPYVGLSLPGTYIISNVADISCKIKTITSTGGSSSGGSSITLTDDSEATRQGVFNINYTDDPACGPTPTPAPGTPTADIKCNGLDSCSITSGNSTTISWSSANVTSCTVDANGWSGISNAGVSSGPLASTTTYNLSCSGADGPATDSVTVAVNSAPPGTPIITVTPPSCASGSTYPVSISYDANGGAAISWMDVDTTSDFASPFANKSSPTNPQTYPGGFNNEFNLVPNTTYYARVYNGNHSGVASFSVAPCDSPPVGNLDVPLLTNEVNQNCSIIGGWAYDPDTSSDSIQIHYYDGMIGGSNTPFATSTANVDRPDVRTAFGIDGNHGFNISTPPELKDGTEHTVYVYGINTNPIGSNAEIGHGTIACSPPALPVLSCSANPVAVDIGTDTTFTANGGNGSYSWTGGGIPASLGYVPPDNNVTFVTKYSSAGTKTVTVDSDNTQSTCTVTVNPPTPPIPCDSPANCLPPTITPPTTTGVSGQSGDYCGTPTLTVSWGYYDPVTPPTPQSAYQVQIARKTGAAYHWDYRDTGKVSAASLQKTYTVSMADGDASSVIIDFGGTYAARVRVWSGAGVVSDWSTVSSDFSTVSHPYPQVNLTSNKSKPAKNTVVTFSAAGTDIFSNPKQGTELLTFGDGAQSSQPFYTASFPHTYTTEGAKNVSLKVTDNVGYACTLTKNQMISVQKEIPEWIEVAPR